MIGVMPHSPLDMSGFGALFASEIKDAMKNWRGLQVLDVGTGSAGNAVYLAQLVEETGMVYTVDPSSEILENAARIVKQKGLSKRVRLVEGKAESLPLGDSFFDAVVTLMALHHIQDTDRGFQEFNRVLKNDGTYVTVEWTSKASEFIPHPAADFLSADEVRSKLEDHGFAVIDSKQSEYYFYIKSQKKQKGK
jgi:ubiquinone/menaquinone biosynthesis C-methylase UbiE